MAIIVIRIILKYRKIVVIEGETLPTYTIRSQDTLNLNTI
jgi:hypothetical protein